MPTQAAEAIKLAMRGTETLDLSIEEEVGFLLLADFMNRAKLTGA